MHCQICTKAKRSNGLSKESQDRNFQNAALCGHAGLKEHKLANLCLPAICPQIDTFSWIWDSLVYWLFDSQDSLEPFSRWITVPCLAE